MPDHAIRRMNQFAALDGRTLQSSYDTRSSGGQQTRDTNLPDVHVSTPTFGDDPAVDTYVEMDHTGLADDDMHQGNDDEVTQSGPPVTRGECESVRRS